MRAVIASLFAAAPLLGPSPLSAVPPDDIAAYCRSTHLQAPLQERCVEIEHAAATRLGRVGPNPDPAGWNRCRAAAASWSDMEQCLAEPGRGAPIGGPGAAEIPPGPAAPAAEPRNGGVTAVAPAAPPGPLPETLTPPPSSTVILGPQPAPVPPSERERPTRVLSEEDAERQLRSVLERAPNARCTKKRYGPGWVMTCE